MKCCQNAEPTQPPLRSEAGWCCGMCIPRPPEKRAELKYAEAVRCYFDEHRHWAYFRFWRSARQWPARAEPIGNFYTAAASDSLDPRLHQTNQRYAKRFYKRAAQHAPTEANLHRLAEQYRILATLSPPDSKAARAYDLKAHAVRARPATAALSMPL